MSPKVPEIPQFKKAGDENHNKRRKRFSKSLSELEFEEVKGFMDLGFVFSEEDMLDSGLVEIIPGLQRLGQRADHDEGSAEESLTSGFRARPYLSEAWENPNPKSRKMEEKALMKWRVPTVSNEIDMKDGLKWWAHTVASAIR